MIVFPMMHEIVGQLESLYLLGMESDWIFLKLPARNTLLGTNSSLLTTKVFQKIGIGWDLCDCIKKDNIDFDVHAQNVSQV